MASTDPPHRCGIGSGEELDTQQRRLTFTSPIPGNQPAQALAHKKTDRRLFLLRPGITGTIRPLYTDHFSSILPFKKQYIQFIFFKLYGALWCEYILTQYRDVICLY